MREILRNRLNDVAEGPEAPDTNEVRAQIDADRQRQLATRNDSAPVVDGYRVEQNGQWYSLIGPDGEKVGVSKRSADEALAQKDEA